MMPGVMPGAQAAELLDQLSAYDDEEDSYE
jgi:hypothetical protein